MSCFPHKVERILSLYREWRQTGDILLRFVEITGEIGKESNDQEKIKKLSVQFSSVQLLSPILLVL